MIRFHPDIVFLNLSGNEILSKSFVLIGETWASLYKLILPSFYLGDTGNVYRKTLVLSEVM